MKYEITEKKREKKRKRKKKTTRIHAGLEFDMIRL